MTNILASITNLMAISFNFSTDSLNEPIFAIGSVFLSLISIAVPLLIIIGVRKHGGGTRRTEIYRDNVDLSSDDGEDSNVIFEDNSAVNTNATRPQPQKQYCRYCGEELSENAKFCENCGAHVME